MVINNVHQKRSDKCLNNKTHQSWEIGIRDVGAQLAVIQCGNWENWERKSQSMRPMRVLDTCGASAGSLSSCKNPHNFPAVPKARLTCICKQWKYTDVKMIYFCLNINAPEIFMPGMRTQEEQLLPQGDDQTGAWWKDIHTCTQPFGEWCT